jgi:Rps23 Pro-64 3,4-dihydroxylase Tpa1-like proline 4-hydroxylase
VRTSNQRWVANGELDTAQILSERVAQIARIPDIGLQEDLQVLRYRPGEHYHAHLDAFRVAQHSRRHAYKHG